MHPTLLLSPNTMTAMLATQNNSNNASTYDNDNGADTNEDEDSLGNAVAGPTVLAHLDMAKTACK